MPPRTTVKRPGVDPVLANIARLAEAKVSLAERATEARTALETEMVRVATLPEGHPDRRPQNAIAEAAGVTKTWMNKLFKLAGGVAPKKVAAPRTPATPRRKAAPPAKAAPAKRAAGKR